MDFAQLVVIILLICYFSWLFRYLYKKKKTTGSMSGCASCDKCPKDSCVGRKNIDS